MPTIKKKKVSPLQKALKKQKPKPSDPVWKGPEVDGVTQSMLSRFLDCRERFRLRYIKGLKPVDQFNHRIEYGQMWHKCEEAFAKSRGQLPIIGNEPGWEDVTTYWKGQLYEYVGQLCRKYPLQQEQIAHWYQVCKTQFPIYTEYWGKTKDRKQRKTLLSEEVFDVPYELPSGRVVRLRGKWDGIELVGRGKGAGVYLLEHKTKGDIREDQMQRQLQFDLQTMLYLVALDRYGKNARGVRYNVVRRPLSGGVGTIRRHKATKNKPEETAEHFYERLGGIISEQPEHFFMRWHVEVSSEDLERFKREFLNPILEQLCDWWDWMQMSIDNKFDPFSIRSSESEYERGVFHWRTPFGIYSALAQGGSTEVDEYLATGSEHGLQRSTELFEELK